MSWKNLKSMGLYNMPGVPEATYPEIFDTVGKLKQRKDETMPAVTGLSNSYTIGDVTASGQDFLFGNPQLGNLSLDDPNQFAISWTNYMGVYQDGLKHLDAYAKTLTSVPDATEAFWPTIATHGAAYNLLILRRVTDARFAELKPLLGQGNRPGSSSRSSGRDASTRLTSACSNRLVRGIMMTKHRGSIPPP